MKETVFLDALRQTRILRPPKHAISTFGTTTMRYVILSFVEEAPGCCRLREGEVTAERPKILTPEFWKNRFEGFEEAMDAYREEIDQVYGDALKGLEYRFRNTLNSTSLEHATLLDVSDRTQKVMEAENSPRVALLEGPDAAWSLSVMKFILDLSLRSFPLNMQELSDRGLLNPEKHQEQRERFEIEKLFQAAHQDRTQVSALGDALKRLGLFKEYEDRFFALIQR